MMCSALQPKRCWPTSLIYTFMRAGGPFNRSMARLLLYGIYGTSSYHMPGQACHCLGTHRLMSKTPARVSDAGFDMHLPTCLRRAKARLGPPGKHFNAPECGPE